METPSPIRGKTTVNVNGNDTPKNFRWTYEIECQFLELLHKEESLGNRVGGTFTPHAYRNILSELQGNFGICVQKKHLRNKIRSLKHNYSEFKDAFRGMSGFAWNWDTKKFDAENEVWEALIQENSSAASIRGKTCLHWDIMNQLWSSSRAVGNTSSTPDEWITLPHRRLDDMSCDEVHPSSKSPNTSRTRAARCSHNVAQNTSNQVMHDVSIGTQPSSGTGSTRMKRKAASEFVIQSNKKNLSDDLADVSRALVDSAEILVTTVSRPFDTSAILFKSLEDLQLADDYLLECYDSLSDNNALANKFLGTSLKFRSAMFQRIMNKWSK